MSDGKLHTLDERIASVIEVPKLSDDGIEAARRSFMTLWMRECAYVYRLERDAREHIDIGGEGG